MLDFYEQSRSQHIPQTVGAVSCIIVIALELSLLSQLASADIAYNARAESVELGGQCGPALDTDVQESSTHGTPATKYSFCLPSFVIAGAQKSGSSALYSYLTMHPSIAPVRSKELHFFDRGKSLAWSAQQFPFAVHGSTDGPPSDEARMKKHGSQFFQWTEYQVTGEATPAYLTHAGFAQGAAALWPDAKVILVLRDPVDRFYSEWWMKQRRVESKAYRRNRRLLGAAHFVIGSCLAEDGLRLRGDGSVAAAGEAVGGGSGPSSEGAYSMAQTALRRGHGRKASSSGGRGLREAGPGPRGATQGGSGAWGIARNQTQAGGGRARQLTPVVSERLETCVRRRSRAAEEVEKLPGFHPDDWELLRDFVRQNAGAPRCIALRLLETTRHHHSKGSAAVQSILGAAKTGIRLHAQASLEAAKTGLRASQLPPLAGEVGAGRAKSGGAQRRLSADDDKMDSWRGSNGTAPGGGRGLAAAPSSSSPLGPGPTAEVEDAPVDSFLRCFADPSSRAEVHQALRDAVATEIALASRCLAPCNEPNDARAQTTEQAAEVRRRRGEQLQQAEPWAASKLGRSKDSPRAARARAARGGPPLPLEEKVRSGWRRASERRVAAASPGRFISSVVSGVSVGPPALGQDPVAVKNAYMEVQELARAGAWGKVGVGEEERVRELLEGPLGLAMSVLREPQFVAYSLFPEEQDAGFGAMGGQRPVGASRVPGMRRLPSKQDPALPWLDQGREGRRRLEDLVWLLSKKHAGSLMQPQSPASSIEVSARASSGFLHPALVPPFAGATAHDAGLGGQEEVWGKQGLRPSLQEEEWASRFREEWGRLGVGARRRWHLLSLMRERAEGGRLRALGGFAMASAGKALRFGSEAAHRQDDVRDGSGSGLGGASGAGGSEGSKSPPAPGSQAPLGSAAGVSLQRLLGQSGGS